MRDLGAGEGLELERDVLGDVAQPGAVREPGEEPAAPPQRAGVVLQRRAAAPTSASLKPGILLEGYSSSTPRSTEHPDDRRRDPDVGAAQDPGLEDPQRRLGPAARTASRPSSLPTRPGAPASAGRRRGGAGRGRSPSAAAAACLPRVSCVADARRASVAGSSARDRRRAFGPLLPPSRASLASTDQLEATASAVEGAQHRRGDPHPSPQVEAVAGRQRVQHDVADHERPVRRTSQASVSEAAPSTMVTLRRPMTSMTMVRPDDARGVLVDAEARAATGSGR